MAVQKTVLKVHISCGKCKKKLMKAVSEIEGVDKIEVDSAKETITVTGNADPYEVILKARKAGKYAEVVTIGPPPAPPKPEQKKQEAKKPEPVAMPYGPCPCPMQYANMGMVTVCYDEPGPSCSIM